jgi:hypothetical protein
VVDGHESRHSRTTNLRVKAVVDGHESRHSSAKPSASEFGTLRAAAVRERR